jgi:hypothetical protein
MKRTCVSLLILVGVWACLATVAAAAQKPAFELNWYGSLKLDGAYDQNLTSNGNFAMWVEPTLPDANDQQFNMTANATRFGVLAQNTRNKNVDITGNIEFDMYAGAFSGPTPQENNPMLLLRQAYFALQWRSTRLTAGQTNDLVSPLEPTTLNYATLWGCGNIGYRRPQVSLAYVVNASPTTDVTLAGGFFRTIGSDLTPTFSLALGETQDISDDGTDAAIPSIQTMMDVNHKMASGGTLRVGLSGLYGSLKAETNLGNYEKYESWAFSTHMMLTTPGGAGVAGEFFTGSNLQSYFGGVMNDSRIEGVRTKGGWLSGWFQPTPQVKLTGGFGIDDPNDEEVISGRTQNRCVFGNVNYSFVPQVTLGLELSQWQTKYVGGANADNFRVQTSMALTF